MFFSGIWEIFLLLAPLLLLGLLMAGLLHILIPRRIIQRLMGGNGLINVISSAAFGIPLPICSCGVVPIAIELRRKGASSPSTISFLITTPESGVDSILVTWALLGPFMAIARPIASFFSAVLAGIFAIGLLREDDKKAIGVSEKAGNAEEGCHDHCHDDDHTFDNEENYVGLRGLWSSFKTYITYKWNFFAAWQPLKHWYKPDIYGFDHYEKADGENATNAIQNGPGVIPLSQIFKRIWRYAFVEMADEILFSLMVGLLLAGLIIVVFPDNLEMYGLGSGVLPMLVMLAVSVPLYMCASASTPIAAALVVKGISPGAAMVFLLAGPATNATTIVMLTRQFGSRFVRIYLGSIIVGSVLAGVVFDYLLVLFGLHIVPAMSMGNHSFLGMLQWTSAIFLLVLIIWRFWNGAGKNGLKELFSNLLLPLRNIFVSKTNESGQENGRTSLVIRGRLYSIFIPLIIFIYLATGFCTVPYGHTGFGVFFGRVAWHDLQPGLHYLPPWPFCKLDVWSTKFPIRIVVGLDQINAGVSVSAVKTGGVESKGNTGNSMSKGRAGSSMARQTKNTNLHPNSTLANDNWNTEYLTGNENLINATVVVQYNIPGAYKYYYKIDQPEQIIYQSTRSVIKELVAQHNMLSLITNEREALEAHIRVELMDHISNIKFHSHQSGHSEEEGKNLLHVFDHGHEKSGKNEISLGVMILSVNIVDIHPLAETTFAFRSVTSAQQNRETAILGAEKTFTMLVPRAIGNAKLEVERAEALGDARRMKATARKKSFLARAEVVSQYRDILQDLLWFETNEQVLRGREKFVLPKGTNAGKLAIWQDSIIEYPQNLYNKKIINPEESNNNAMQKKEAK